MVPATTTTETTATAEVVPTPSATHRAAPPPAGTHKATATTPAKPNCDHPFVIDSNGIKHVKPECM
jgi:hypothetical protein